jgi:hypothetical protein
MERIIRIGNPMIFHIINVTDSEGVDINLDGCTGYLMIKESLTDSDDDAVISIETTITGVVNTFDITVPFTDTVQLQQIPYYVGIGYIDTSQIPHELYTAQYVGIYMVRRSDV